MKKLLFLFTFITFQKCLSQEYYVFKQPSKAIMKTVDSLKNEIFLFKNRNGVNSNKYTGVSEKPKDLKILNRTLFNASTQHRAIQLSFGRGDINGQIYTTLISDEFVSKNKSYLGNISLGSVLSNVTADSTKSQQTASLQNFFNGGGNIFLKYYYLLPFGLSDGYDNFNFLLIPSIRTAANFPKLSENQKIDDWNTEIATEFVASLSGTNNKLGFILKPKVGLVMGNKTFMKRFNSEGESTSKTKSFTYIQIQGAVNIMDKFLVSLSFKPSVSTGNINKFFKNSDWGTIGVQALL